MKEYFDCSVNESMTKPDELNVLRYACGYVGRKLLKQYEKKHEDVEVQYVACLGEMAVEGRFRFTCVHKAMAGIGKPRRAFPLE